MESRDYLLGTLRKLIDDIETGAVGVIDCEVEEERIIAEMQPIDGWRTYAAAPVKRTVISALLYLTYAAA